MNKIHILSESVANKIAAGEVIERPASIVKELVENSLDAGASRIEIEIRNGGKSLIRVSDNGAGIDAAELETAFLRHATSKLHEADDLNSIQSFGFRGEALPSIAAVSRCRAVSATTDSDSGKELLIHGGAVIESNQCAPRQGTTIEVSDLFFNTPARRKFLRADATETGHILEIVTNMALAYPKVHFSLHSAKRTLLNAQASDSLMERAAAVLGEDVAQHLLEIKGTMDGVSITGLIGKASIARANRNGQRFFINRRWIKSIGFSYAVQEGYYGRLMHGQYPVAILFIEIDPERVDVNVHPTKQQVRISQESALKALLMDIIAKRLADSSQVHIQPDTEDHPPEAETPFDKPQAWPTPQPTRSFVLSDATPAYNTDPRPLPIPPAFKEEQTRFEAASEDIEIRRVLGQLHKTYIVAESSEGLLLVDQHAAHERVMFESLQHNMEQDAPETQALLLDEVLELHPNQLELFEKSLPWLSQIGFDLENFGESSYVIRGIPALFGDESPAQILKRYIEEKETGAIKGSIEKHTDELAALIACKRKSVKAQDNLNLEAMQVLLQRLTKCKNPHHCPHGRPTWVKYTLYELERQFKRVV